MFYDNKIHYKNDKKTKDQNYTYSLEKKKYSYKLIQGITKI